MDEYNPDNPNQKMSSDNFDDRKRIAIDDRTPLSESNPKYKEKYLKHKEAGVAFMMCPICHKMGCHAPTIYDYPRSRTPIGGEICDICGYEETYDIIVNQ